MINTYADTLKGLNAVDLGFIEWGQLSVPQRGREGYNYEDQWFQFCFLIFLKAYFVCAPIISYYPSTCILLLFRHILAHLIGHNYAKFSAIGSMD
jgi:hypothetical protein